VPLAPCIWLTIQIYQDDWAYLTLI
jgi:hypothetical protein